MANKRQLDDSGGGPPAKNAKVQYESVFLGPISTLDEMDAKVLKFQNRKLYQKLEQRKRVEEDLRSRIEQLEKRQAQSDDVLTVINRYWNQFNEDTRLMLQRYDAETADESENENEGAATTSFLTQLSTWDRDELDEKLANRVQVSRRAVAKIIQAFDRLHQRNEKITKALKGESDVPIESVDEVVKDLNTQLQSENKSLHAQNLSLHEKNHLMTLRKAELDEKVQSMEIEHAEMHNRLEEMEYELNKARNKCEKVEANFTDACQKLKNMQDEGITQGKNTTAPSSGSASKINSTVAAKKLEELNSELEESKELAAKRLDELEKKTNDYKEALKEVERLKMDLRQLPESIIVETTEYKCLQSQFSVLYNESMQLKTQTEEMRTQLQTTKNVHMRQIEQMESEELLCQKKLRAEVIQLEDMLSQIRKEYEMLRIEFEQNLAANEQTGPINREMRHLITSLQNHIQQLKGEITRYKRKYKDVTNESLKIKKDLDEANYRLSQRQRTSASERQDSVSSDKGEAMKETIKDEGGDSYDPSLSTGDQPSSEDKHAELQEPKKEENDDEKTEDGDKKDEKIKKEVKKEIKEGSSSSLKESKENEIIKALKNDLKKAQSESRELKLLLDMYKAQGVGKEQRDKVQLMAAEKKARQEVEELKSQVKKLQESKKEERKKLADEEAIRKIKQLEDSVTQLTRQVSAQKLEEEALVNEMEVTGQAFEETQDQNVRLIQQLREKDNANFKLMSERIKSNQINKLANEERDNLSEQVSTLTTQVDAQVQVVKRLEEKERLLQNILGTVEKELLIRQQALEMHKRKAIESAQSAADLKLHLEKYHAQMKEAQQVVAEKTITMEQEAFKYRRMLEELASLRRKVERAKKFESAERADEVLLEENKEYKDMLTCPSCKSKKKDAVLIKCFHVFCFDCLKTRYETRQRKCPKCNAAFGANDYHRLYLS